MTDDIYILIYKLETCSIEIKELRHFRQLLSVSRKIVYLQTTERCFSGLLMVILENTMISQL